MARALVLLLSIAVLAHAEGEKKAKKAECPKCPADLSDEVAKLKKDLAAAKTELLQTQESLANANKNAKAAADAEASKPGELDVVMSVDEIVDVASQLMPELPKMPDTDALATQAQALGVQYADAAQSALTDTYKHVGALSKTLQDLHEQHVGEKATNEYIEAATQLYNEHLAAHVELARKAYNDNVQPHVDKISPTVSAAANTGMEQLSSLSKQATDLGASQEVSKKFGWLVESKEYKVLGRTMSFKYGYVDMILGGTQAFLMGLVFLFVTWTVFYKIFTRLGFTITIWSLKGTFTVSMFVTKIFVKVFGTTTKLAIQLGLFAAFSAVGVLVAHVADKEAKLGLPIRQRLLVGAISGFMFYFICWLICPCCKRKKKEDNKTSYSNGSTNGKKGGAPVKAKSEPAAKKGAASAKKGATKK